MHLELMAETSVDSTSERVSGILDLIGSSASGLSEVAKLLQTSSEFRELGPLLVDGLSSMIASGHPHTAGIRRICALLTTVCRPRELHMFCMEAWINLWSRECDCKDLELPGQCSLSLARAVLAQTTVDVIARTQKGPLYNNRENYLLSIGGQILSKFFMPESLSPVHEVSSEWILVVTKLADAVLALNSPDRSDMHTQANAEVAIRLVSAAVECIVAHEADWFSAALRSESSLRTLLSVLLSNESTLAMLNSRMIAFDVTVDDSRDPFTRSADFELEATDVALIVLADAFVRSTNPCLVPLLWSSNRSADVLVTANLILLKSRFFVAAIAYSLRLNAHLGSIVLSSPLSGEWMESLFRVATSVGDERVLSLAQRQSVFSAISGLMDSTDPTTAVQVCSAVAQRSCVDSVVGLTLKLLKDVWTKHSLPVSLFHASVSPLLGEEYQVLDGIDTLKSILNWARLVYLQHEKRSVNDHKFRTTLEKLGKQIDAELGLLQCEATNEDMEMKRTRLIFIGHLVSRVRELFDGSECCNSHR